MKAFSIFSLSICSAFAGPNSDISNGSLLNDLSWGGWSLSSASAGLAWRNFGGVRYSGSSQSQNLIVPSQVGSSSLGNPMIGGSGLASRIYNDGFVNQDSTVDPSGDTWFWGYDSGTQIQGNSLVFSATGSQSIYQENITYENAPDFSDDLTGIAKQIDFVFAPPEGARGGFEGVLVSLWHFKDDQKQSFSNFALAQVREDYRLDFTDTFALNLLIPPSAPYSGSSDGPGPIIGNIPTTRDDEAVLLNTDTALFSNNVKASLDLEAFSIAIGPTIRGELREKWLWEASAGVTLNYFDWSARQTEELSLSINGAAPTVYEKLRDSKSGGKFRLGIYGKASLTRELKNNYFVSGYLQGEVAKSFDVKVGDSTFEISPAGYAWGLSFGRSF